MTAETRYEFVDCDCKGDKRILAHAHYRKVKDVEEEYVFQFACNKKELLELKKEIDKALKYLEKRKKLMAYQKTPAFWKKIRREENNEKG